MIKKWSVSFDLVGLKKHSIEGLFYLLEGAHGKIAELMLEPASMLREMRGSRPDDPNFTDLHEDWITFANSFAAGEFHRATIRVFPHFLYRMRPELDPAGWQEPGIVVLFDFYKKGQKHPREAFSFYIRVIPDGKGDRIFVFQDH